MQILAHDLVNKNGGTGVAGHSRDFPLFRPDGNLGVGEFFVAALVAAFVDSRVPVSRCLVSGVESHLMSTVRGKLRCGHPFFERMGMLRQLFLSFEEAEHEWRGAYQDKEIELRFRAPRGNVGDYEDECLVAFGMETDVLQTMQRLCQIVLLYSTFELFCTGKLRDRSGQNVDESLVRRARNELEKKGKEPRNFVLVILELAEKEGMQSREWPTQRSHMEVFVKLRNHLVHHGLEMSEKLRAKLLPLVGTVGEIKGNSAEHRVQSLGELGSLIQIPREFISRMFELLEELAAALVVPVDHDAPEVDLSTLDSFKQDQHPEPPKGGVSP